MRRRGPSSTHRHAPSRCFPLTPSGSPQQPACDRSRHPATLPWGHRKAPPPFHAAHAAARHGPQPVATIAAPATAAFDSPLAAGCCSPGPAEHPTCAVSPLPACLSFAALPKCRPASPVRLQVAKDTRGIQGETWARRLHTPRATSPDRAKQKERAAQHVSPVSRAMCERKHDGISSRRGNMMPSHRNESRADTATQSGT